MPQTDKCKFKTGTVTSADGTTIGYRQIGTGPGVILVHGGMASSQSLMKLARSLTDSFAVYIPDRRGRGLSGPFGDDYGIQKEVEDLGALLTKTGAHNVFGLSSGALISLQAALKLPSIHKTALYEPPLAIDHSIIDIVASSMQRFDREIEDGKLAAALVTVLKDLELLPRSLLSILPRFLLERFFTLALREDAKNIKEGYVPLQTLIHTQHYDYQLVIETEGTLENFKELHAEVLLLGGSKSPSFLKNTLDALNKALPNVKYVVVPGLDHVAPTDNGNPERVAQELRHFFA